MYIFNSERKSFYTIIKNSNLSGSGDPVVNFNGVFENIFKIELIKIMSKRKAVVKITQLFSIEPGRTITITFRKGLVMLHNYDIRFRSFDHSVLGTLEEIYNHVTKTRFFNYYQNKYLSNRLNDLTVKRIKKLTFDLNKIIGGENTKLKLRIFKKFYNTSRWIFYKFKPMINEYYGKHNNYPIEYMER